MTTAWAKFIAGFGVSAQPRPSANAVRALNHFTIRCTREQLPALVDFYTRVLGLDAGPRPEMRFPGYWLYSGGFPIVHLAGTAVEAHDSGSGRVDHVAFTGHSLEQMRQHLSAEGVPFEDAPISGWPLQQLFVRDPAGVKVELTFFVEPEVKT